MRRTGVICIVSRKIVSDAWLGTLVTLSASETSEAAIEAASLSELNSNAAPKRSQKKFFTPPAMPERPSASLAGEPTSIATPRGVTARFHTAKRSEEHTSELQSLMRISYAVFCLKKKKQNEITLI